MFEDYFTDNISTCNEIKYVLDATGLWKIARKKYIRKEPKG